jgi:hypothetical protein
MGKHVIRQTPHAMPSPERVRTITDKLPQLFFVAGSRGNTRADNKVADYELHGTVRYVGWQPSVLRRKHVVVLTHGYNCTTDETLVSAADFFGKLHASLVRDGVAPGSYAFVLFAWPGDTGTVYFDSAQVYAQHSGVALYKLLDAAAQAKPMSLTVVTHSLGAHVGLRGLAVLGERLVRRKAPSGWIGSYCWLPPSKTMFSRVPDARKNTTSRSPLSACGNCMSSLRAATTYCPRSFSSTRRTRLSAMPDPKPWTPSYL